MKKLLALLLALLLVFGLTACGGNVTAEDVRSAAETVSAIAGALSEPETVEAAQPDEDVEFAEEILVPDKTAAQTPDETPEKAAEETPAIDEDGVYTSKDDVALYIHTYSHLPQNFISKKQAAAISEITKEFCPKRTEGPTPNATLTRWGPTSAGPSASCFQTTALFITPKITMRRSSFSMGRTADAGGH